MSNVSPLYPNRAANPQLERIRRELAEGRAQIRKGLDENNGEEWSAGSVKVAVALRDGLAMVPDGLSLSAWLIENGFDIFTPSDRDALVKLAQNVDLMRATLASTKSRSWQVIWRDHKYKYSTTSKRSHHPPAGAPKEKRAYAPRSRMRIHYSLKFGDEAMEKIRGTTLDNSHELNELLMLNRGAENGEVLPEVQKLIDRAAAGEDVSALSYSATQFGLPKRVVKDIVGAWRKRMLFTWDQADIGERTKLIEYLITNIEPADRKKLMETLFDRLV